MPREKRLVPYPLCLVPLPLWRVGEIVRSGPAKLLLSPFRAQRGIGWIDWPETQVVDGADDRIVSFSHPQCLEQAASARKRENEVSCRLRHHGSLTEESVMPFPKPNVYSTSARRPCVLLAKRKGLQLALEPLNGPGIAGYVPKTVVLGATS